MKKNYTLLLSLLFITFNLSAQKPVQSDAADILLGLKKLNFLGSVLYLAAHPDDENTRLIAYMANERLANTAYLSMTRGDGGQNLVGPEIREALGVIRTQELLAARRIDGGQQFFTRANDFGYSKSAEETQEIWDREKALSDVVWVYRTFRPDIIITRFPGDGRGGHGHHTTSAIFAAEAFDLSADNTSYKDQLEYVDTWQPTRLYTNTGRWWNKDISSETLGVVTIDVGAYNPLLGESYNEMASRSRSQHKSQGFGSTGSRGEQEEFLEYKKGDQVENDVFEGIDTSWNRVEGGKGVDKMIETIINNYNPEKPHEIVPALLDVRTKISAVKDQYWKDIKLKETDALIKSALGLYLEVSAGDYSATPDSQTKFNIEVINRSPMSVTFKKINYTNIKDSVVDLSLGNNNKVNFSTTLTMPKDIKTSEPYWLRKEGTLGMYRVDDRQLIGKPENDAALNAQFDIEIEGQLIQYQVPIIYKWNDPVKGEQYRPFIITPPVFVNIPEPVYIFSDNINKTVSVTVKAATDNIRGIVKLDMPEGWKSIPENHKVNLELKEAEQIFEFEITPPQNQSTGQLKAAVIINENTYNKSIQTIDYEHITTQVLMPEAVSKIVKIDIKKSGDMIGYIAGAGDVIPASMREIGYEVWEMKDEEITPENLSKVDAVVLGIRALNTNERITHHMKDLLDYVHEGGTLVIQYNTSHRLLTDEFMPYPLQLSRDRVTDEYAEVRILKPNHPVLNYPNKITQKDFEGWVQERGLYFPNEWDEHYEAILSSNDVGESPKDGGLLVAKYGKGYYVYSGYSYFRELPAGVAGAYRLFVNLVSLGSNGQELKSQKGK